MQYELVESIPNSSQVIYDFKGFDNWQSMNKIVNIIKEDIKPNKLTFSGRVNFDGYFEKDGLQVEVHQDETKRTYLEFRGQESEKNFNKIRVWAKVIFSELMYDELEQKV
ncbi:hypothetical protein NNC19_18940 [Clostridium sp. SHJSY1]|uniref:hypothetical protein n=1 Tax=Clostridium sp. SHJSY1 TaxID=2942483 RepID=UPI0028755EA1|nr:hypothetical protein [Clostridium sp. SHJSY1]MDS0527771.1 hypothetical protein [Clostridium sp. SHJSY1]